MRWRIASWGRISCGQAGMKKGIVRYHDAASLLRGGICLDVGEVFSTPTQ